MAVSKLFPNESKFKYLNFAITKALSIFLTEILHAGRGAINMKHIKWEAKSKHFLEYGHVAYQIKANDKCSKMIANILPTDTPSIPRMGSKGQTISESSHVAYQIKGN